MCFVVSFNTDGHELNHCHNFVSFRIGLPALLVSLHVNQEKFINCLQYVLLIIILSSTSFLQLVAPEPCLRGKRGDPLLEMTCQQRKVVRTGGTTISLRIFRCFCLEDHLTSMLKSRCLSQICRSTESFFVSAIGKNITGKYFFL